ncbi:efflux RND transporter permease subunit [Leptospira sp. WS39.C2]
MRNSIFQLYPYQCFFGIGCLILFSILSSPELQIGEWKPEEESQTLIISQNWPGKTASQLEESLIKPWEMMLKSVGGYREIKSTSEFGSVTLYLNLIKGYSKEELLQSVRNLYLLNQNKFPREIHFPRFRYDSDSESNFILLKRNSNSQKNSLRHLESKIKDLTWVNQYEYIPEFQSEIQIEIKPNVVFDPKYPSITEIFHYLQNQVATIQYDPRVGRFFLNEFPRQKENWEKVSVPLQNKGVVLLSQIATIQLKRITGKNQTRINGSGFESILIHTTSVIQQMLLLSELESLLEQFPDWHIVFSNHEELILNIKGYLFFYILIEILFVLYFGIVRNHWFFVFVNIISYFTLFVLITFLFSKAKIPLGDPSFVFLILIRYPLTFISLRVLFVKGKQIIFFLFVFGFGIYLKFFPNSVIGILLLLILSLFFYPLVQDLLVWMCNQKKECLRMSQSTKTPVVYRILINQKQANLNYLKFLTIFVFFIILILSFRQVFTLIPTTSNSGSIQMAKLEFPTYVTESERNRITKQVEETILNKNWTNLLVVKLKNFRSDFYMKFNENVAIRDFSRLPTEMGYFHFTKENGSIQTYTLRFTNPNPVLLEESVLKLLPWLKSQKQIEEVVLGFQPSIEGLGFQTNSSERVMMDWGMDPSIKEMNFILHENVASKMVGNGKLIDVKLKVPLKMSMDEFKKHPFHFGSGYLTFVEFLRNYNPKKILGKIYHKDVEISMEIFVKGDEINWDKIHHGISQLLSKEDTRFVEQYEASDEEPKYRIVYLMVLVMTLILRKKYVTKYFCLFAVMVFIWKTQNIMFTRDYLQFSLLLFLIVFFQITVPLKKQNQIYFSLPYIGLFIGSFLYPWGGGNYLFQTITIFLLYGFFVLKWNHFLELFRTRS